MSKSPIQRRSRQPATKRRCWLDVVHVPQIGAATDSVIEENVAGLVTGAGTTVVDVLFPSADGSSWAVQ